MNKDWTKKEKAALYDTPVKRLLRACGLALVNKHLSDWYVTNPAWNRLQKWDEEHGND